MKLSSRHPASLGALILLAVTCLAAPARAQYFGQNKVRYESPHFQVLATEHFDVYYSDEGRGVATRAAEMAERWHARLSRRLEHTLSRRQPLLLYPSHPSFQQTNAIPGELSEGVGGVTESFKRRVVLPVAGSMAQTDHVIGHELVHAFQYDIGGSGGALGVSGGIERLPLWFIEGMAEYYSVGAEDPHTAMWMRDAAVNDRLPNYGRLFDPRYFPYRYGQALWCYVGGRYGDAAVAQVLKAAGPSGDPKLAIRKVLGVDADSLIEGWHATTRAWSRPIAAATLAASRQGHPLVMEKKGVGRLNLAPALSPDGRWLVFLSERSRFAVEMYLADARTGRIERQITKTTVDPHIQTLGFIASSGAFSPDGRQVAFATARGGRPTISILEVPRGRIVREQRFEHLGEITSPSWSPDGRRMVFSALAGGVTDLWVLDLDRGEARRLTDDAHADLQPAWSPDGRRIAFVTDRFGAGPRGYRLALIDPGSGAIEPVTAFEGARHINPAWSADGTRLFFAADRNGISDIYRITLRSGEIRQVTRLLTGVSGLTAVSPAFSVAAGADRLVFSAYENGSYNLYRLDGEAALAGEAPHPAPSPDAGVLPTAAPGGAPVPEPVATAAARVDTSRFRRREYRSRLSLDHISQVSLGVAGGSNGIGVGGGAALLWSDMLGDHNLATQLQVLSGGGKFVNNTALVLGYWNLASRWNWGLQASQIPYVTSDFFEEIVDVNGQPALAAREIRYWQIDRALRAGAAYPFSRFRRVELSAGVRRIGFDAQIESRYFDQNGLLFARSTEDVPGGPDPLTLATGGVAMVFDNTVSGGLGPVLGHRYRFEVDPVIGSIDFAEVLGDYRRYLPVARPLLLAGRVLHYGRYGAGGEDPRLSPLFIGYPSLVRGYESGSFTLAECQPSPGDPMSCPAFDRLLGSRIAVVNLEARLPLLGALGLIPSPGIPPIEAALFFDAGTAWARGVRPRFLGDGRQTVTSVGVALRVNLFGFAAGEVDLVRPNDRPLKGWHWQFSIQPGF